MPYYKGGGASFPFRPEPAMPKSKPRTAYAAIVLAILVLALSGCQGIVNNNPDLRWFLFSHFGASRVCPELLKMGVPIRLHERGPGRGASSP